MNTTRLMLLVLLLCATHSLAKNHTIELGKNSVIDVSVPYSLGTHRGTVRKVTGQVGIDLHAKMIGTFKLEIAIADIDMGKAKMNCHMHEALGLHYETSDFPENHVCDSKNGLPQDGKNAITHPTIAFEAKFINWSANKEEVELRGTWKIHGKEKDDMFTVKLSKNDLGWRAVGKHTLLLSDFGVQVKPFLLIKVKGPVHLAFDFNLKEIP